MVPAKTNSSDCISRGRLLQWERLLLWGCLLILAGCQASATPPCPYQGKPEYAPSAGCMTVENGKLLVVQGRNGKIGPPGGSAEQGESAQCTAFRETWEETGLSVVPKERLAVFDTGFHLYRCERLQTSGDIDPMVLFEIRAAFFLAPEEFDDWEWRFGGQQLVMSKLLDTEVGKLATMAIRQGREQSGQNPVPPGKN